MFKYYKKQKYFTLIITLLLFSFFILINNTQAANDAIGIRVYSNINHLSPSEWYYNTVEYPGSPQLIQVDGYEAVMDGGTAYVAATNRSSGDTYYTNIYLLTHNVQATPETINIFNQLIDNWYFNTNITDPDDKGKITRDTKRLADLQTTADLLEAYGLAHSYCSVSGTQCQENSDCTSPQTCEPHYPELGSGSFVQGQSTSKWPSWLQTLAPAINAPGLQTDPTNEFVGCISDPLDPQYFNYDPNTCWNETTNDFSCVENSRFYYYNTETPLEYNLATEAEIISTTNLDNEGTLDEHLNIEGYIGGVLMCSAVGLGTFCGNTIVEPPEVCEVGETRPYCDDLCGEQDWHLDVVTGCNNDCTWYDPFYDPLVIPTICTPEIEGDYCGGFCDDGELQALWEECDPNTSTIPPFDPILPSGWSCIGSATLDCDDNCEMYCYPSGDPPYNGECGNTTIEFPETCEEPYDPPEPAQSSLTLQYECINCDMGGGYCGDGECQISYEDIISCDVDCPPETPGYFNIYQNTLDPMGTLDLEWGNVIGEDGFKIWQSLTPGSFPDPGSPTYTLGFDVLELSDSGLSNNTHYYYKLVSYSGAGSSNPVYADESTSDSFCGDFEITGSEVCDDGLQGTTGPAPLYLPGKNGVFGHCNVDCTGIEGVCDDPLFYDNFEDEPETLLNWNWDDGYCPGACQWSTELIDTYKRKSYSPDTGEDYPRDAWVTDLSVASMTDVDEIVMLEFTSSDDRDSLLIARRSGDSGNRTEDYYALWTDYAGDTAIVRMKNGLRSGLAMTNNINDGVWWVQFKVTNEGIYNDVRLQARWWEVLTDLPDWCAPNTTDVHCIDYLDTSTDKITTAGNVGIAGWIDSTFYYDNYMVCDPNASGPSSGDGTIFIGSDHYPDGDLLTEAQVNYGYLGDDGLGAGDHLCQGLANGSSAVESGIWRAWLSSDGIEGNYTNSTRLVDSGFDYKTPVGGNIVENDLSGFFDASIMNEIDRDESGFSFSHFPWTGTNEYGNVTTRTCNGWTSTDYSLYGTTGHNIYTHYMWTRDWDWDNWDCSGQYHSFNLYCLYQGTTNYWPDPPSYLVATAGVSDIVLTWSDNSNNEAGFEIYRSSYGLNQGTWGTTPIASVGQNIEQYNDNTATPGLTYYYKVRAKRDYLSETYYSYFSNIDDSVIGSPMVVGNIFISSAKYVGDLDGFAGADQKCQDLADNSTLVEPGPYKAILSGDDWYYGSNIVDAKDRIVHAGEIRDVFGNIIASNYDSLWNPPYILNSPIIADEQGITQIVELYDDVVWSGTSEEGVVSGGYCYSAYSSWSEDNIIYSGLQGQANSMNPGEWISSPAPLPDSCHNERRIYCLRDDVAGFSNIFITSQTYKGNLKSYYPSASSGIEAADMICQELADNSPLLLPGVYRAIMSDDNEDAKYRIIQPYPLVETDGSTFSQSYGPELWSWGTRPNYPIHMTELGTPTSGVSEVWTSTRTDGLSYSSHNCNNWDDPTNSYLGRYGGGWGPNGEWIDDGYNSNDHCNDLYYHLYCLRHELPSQSQAGNIFITSGQWGGNFLSLVPGATSGINAADQLCQDLADTSGYLYLQPGAYKAIISGKDQFNNTIHAKDRINQPGEITDVYGNIIASNYSDLFSPGPGPNIAISFNENSNQHYGNDEHVWSGTYNSGTNSSHDCNEWTDSTSSEQGQNGRILVSGWIGLTSEDCDNQNRLYCVKSEPVGNIFITSGTYSGDLNGLSGADQICQGLADSSNMLIPGTYKAILSTTFSFPDPGENARDRIIHSGEIRDVHDNLVAASYTALMSAGPMITPIEYDETGVSRSNVNVWTGTNQSGFATGDDCDNWEHDGGYWATYGKSVGFSSDWIEYDTTHGCSPTPLRRLYCLRED